MQSMKVIANSRWRAIRAKTSPCEGWLRFPVVKSEVPSRLGIFDIAG